MNPARSKPDLLSLLIESEALQFGAFTLKSGRISPYFFNAGRFCTGPQLAALGEAFAEAIQAAAPEISIVFGPAYKGIPLSLSATMALSRLTGRSIGYLFNRKEEKTHGDRGRVVGRLPEAGDRLVLVDDVVTDGSTKREAVALLRENFPVPIDALVVAFDRMERDAHGRDPLAELQRTTGIPTVALFSLADLEQALAAGRLPAAPGLPPPAELLERLRDYRRQYGVVRT